MNVNSVERPSLLFVIPTLGHGGAQKILVEVVQCLSCEYKVTVLTLRENGNDVYSVEGFADLLSLDLIPDNKITIGTVLKAPLKLRSVLKRLNPVIVVSFQDIANFALLLGSVGLKNVGLIVSERQDTRFYPFAFLRKVLRSVLYVRADSIVVQTDLIEEQFPGWLRNKIAVIPNQISSRGQSNPAEPDSDGVFRVVAAGRLERQKDFKILIDAASYLVEEFGNWRIDIYGQGSLCSELNGQIESRKLEEFVFINKPQKNLNEIFERSNLFVLSSIYEGFPNVLAEAVACGLPVIAFSGVSGTTELVDDEKNGYLVSKRDPEELSEKMRKIMLEEQCRASFGRYSSSVASRYEPASVFEQWGRLISRLR